MAEKETFFPTKFDKALIKYAPGWGKARIRNKLEALAMTGAYEATRSGKRPYSNFLQFLTSPNTRASSLERQELINFSRFLNMTGIGAAYSSRLTNHAIGNGLGFRAAVNAEYLGLNEKQALEKNKELTRFWKLFWNGENGNAERMYNGGYFQGLIFKSMLDGGDNVVIPTKTRPRKNHRFPFALRSYESELISTPRGKESDESFIDGFQRNDEGVPTTIYIAKSTSRYGQQDASYFNANNWEPRDIFGPNTGIRQVFHLKNLTQDRPGAIRGIPFLAPATGLIIDHNEFAEAVLKTAKAQAVFAGLFTGGKGKKKLGGAPSGLQDDGDSYTFPRVDMTAGIIVDLPDGYELKAFESSQPKKEFTDFQMHELAVISAITGIPRSFILMLFGESYSASKGELAIFWVTVLRFRYAFVFQFLFPFWEYLLSWGVGSGLISAPGFFDNPETKAAWLGDPIHQFTGPNPPVLDLSKEAKGLVALKEGRLKSARRIIEENFTDDPEETFQEIKEEEERGVTAAIVRTIAATGILTEEQPEDDQEDTDNQDDQNQGDNEQT